jgi:hypothetical protein
MGSRFFFFTDPSLLAPQTAAQAYGPAGTANGKDQFRVTDRHDRLSSSDALSAVAICDGVLCAQQDDNGTLSLILKPSEAPPFDFPVVSYFIYKGVAKTSLLNGDAVLDVTASGATPFTKRIAVEWEKQNGALTGSSAALGLDRDATFVDGTAANPGPVFTDADPIDHLFRYPHPTVQLPLVAAGEVIGSFQGGCGLEIVLQRLGYEPRLALARRAENDVSVTTLPATNAGVAWQADDHAFFSHWHEKEQVLAYLDPCAFFGAFVQSGMYRTSATGTSVQVKGHEVYGDILSSFANRNVAYLDIRNNYGYSYNLFGLYTDTIRFVAPGSGSQTHDLDFRAGSWPIRRLTIADIPGVKRRSVQRTKLALPVGQSVAPAVLVSTGFVTRLGAEPPKFKTPTIAAAGAGDPFYPPFRLGFAAREDGGQAVLSCTYTRVNLYEKPRAGQPASSPLDVAGGHYLDGVFRPRALRLGAAFSSHRLRFVIYHEEVLVDLEQVYGPTYAASVGIAEDPDHVTLFAFPRYFLPNTYSPGERRPLPSWADTATGDTADFLIKLIRTFRYTDITRQTITPVGSTADVDTLIVRHEPSVHHNALTDKNFVEDYCLVVLDKPDYAALLAEIAADPAILSALPGFLTVAAFQAKQDVARDVDYTEFTFQHTGFAQSATNKVTRHATSLGQRVYEHAVL